MVTQTNPKKHDNDNDNDSDNDIKEKKYIKKKD